MINARRPLHIFFTSTYDPSTSRLQTRWATSISSNSPALLVDHAAVFPERLRGNPPPEIALVSALKNCGSIRHGEQIQCLVMKSGLSSNIYIQNSLIHLYANFGHITTARSMFESCHVLDTASWNIMIIGHVKMGLLDYAWTLFAEMPDRDCVSYTTIIMGFVENDQSIQALQVFRDMRICRVKPNEVTLVTVVSACRSLQAKWTGKGVHGIVIKSGFEVFVLVSTNLVNMYICISCLEEAEAVFRGMKERNVVTWNVMLNGYSKSGNMDLAKGLFEQIPVKDLVSWSTMIDACVRADRLPEALVTFCEMRRLGFVPNEVTVVDLLSACSNFSAASEGKQLHSLIIRTALDSHFFVQATIIHFYAACELVQEARLQFCSSNKDSVSPWNALIAGFVKNNMTDSARELFEEMPVRDIVSWSSMISGYVQSKQFDMALNLFQEMQERGLRPNDITMVSVVSAIAHSGIPEQAVQVHHYILESSIPITDNLCAGLIDMYAKCGSIDKAWELFSSRRDKFTTISPWNAMIHGLAMHGFADKSLSMFQELIKTGIVPNSVTFVGVLCACCHAGLVESGRRYFDCMKAEYNIKPNIKHYGCMVDLLGKAGYLDEAETLIEEMPVQADVVIWGSLLAACRTHGNLEKARRAKVRLSALQPDHGAGAVMYSNMFAEAQMWEEMVLFRKEMRREGVKKMPACSGVM